MYSCQCRTSQFLESVATTQTINNASLQCNKSRNFFPFPCLGSVWHWESATPVYLVIYGQCSQQFSCRCSYVCTCFDHELWMTLVGFCANLRAIKSCLPLVYPWHLACDKMYQDGLGMRLASNQLLLGIKMRYHAKYLKTSQVVKCSSKSSSALLVVVSLPPIYHVWVAFSGKIQAKFCTVTFAPGEAYYTLHTSCGT